MPVDPQLQDVLNAMESAGFPKLTIPPAELRAMTLLRAPATTKVRLVSDVAIPHDGGTIPARLYQSSPTAAGVIVYYHGGGWVAGDLDDVDETLRILANATNCAVISVDYRLAPENPFPAAVEDAFIAVQWAADQRGQIAGRANAPLIVMGDSAGGNLSAVVSQLARDSGGPDISLQVLLYPATEGDVDRDAMYAFESPFLTRDEIIWFYNHYIPIDRRHDPRFAPGKAADLANLPPAVIVTAEYDLLADEALLYGRKLQAAGVEVTQLHYDGAIHGFFTFAPAPDISRRAHVDVVGRIAQVIAASTNC